MQSVFTPLAMASAAIAVSAVFVNFVIVAMRMPHLPDKVPCHFGISGKPDAWSGKWVVWVLPGLSLLFVLVIGGALALENMGRAESARRDTEMMSGMTACVAMMSLIITFRTFSVAEKRAQGLGWWAAPVFLMAMILAALGYSL